jgi:hypothetical protein
VLVARAALADRVGVGSSRSPGAILALQRTAGNAAVGRLLARQQGGGSTVAPAATVPNHISGEIGEHLLSQALDRQGMFVFTDWGKHVAGNGIDRVALHPVTGELWVIDNKAQWRGISGADALTGAQYTTNLAEVERFLAANGASKEAAAALGALRAGRVRRVVANAFAGETTRFTAGLFAKGLSVFDVRLGRMFATQVEWAAAFTALRGLRRGFRISGLHGSALFEGTMLVFAVAGGVAYAAKAGESIKQAAGAAAADAALGAIITRLPGGWIASLALNLESDNQYQIEMSNRIDQLTPLVPGYDQMNDEDKKATRGILRDLIENPLELDPPAPPAKPKLPGFKWPGEIDPDKMAGDTDPSDDAAVA